MIRMLLAALLAMIATHVLANEITVTPGAVSGDRLFVAACTATMQGKVYELTKDEPLLNKCWPSGCVNIPTGYWTSAYGKRAVQDVASWDQWDTPLPPDNLSQLRMRAKDTWTARCEAYRGVASPK